jgi:hypothetical protein
MGVDRVANSKFRNRLKKNAGDRRRREKVHRRRLIALGVPEEKVNHMTADDVRTLLKRPGALKAS